MMKRSILGLSLLLSVPFALSCDSASNSMTVPPKVLRPGGVYVATNNGCDEGCDKIARGDLIQTIDGKEVKTTSDFLAANVTDGQPQVAFDLLVLVPFYIQLLVLGHLLDLVTTL